MTRPAFSIIIPTLNAQSVISCAVESIIGQTYSDFEVLIMDGQSTDNTLEIIKTYSDERIVTDSSKDQSVYDAMNRSISMAKGEWLFFLGSDDQMADKDVLSDIISEIELSESRVIYGNVKILGDAGWAKDGTVYDGKFDLKKLLNHNICHQSIFYHRDAIAEIGLFNLNYRICADYDYNLRAFAEIPFQFTDRIIAYFNGGGMSVVSKDDNFSADLDFNIVFYFRNKLYRNEFIDRRLVIRACALGKSAYKYSLSRRIWFGIVYLILKIKSYFIPAKVYSFE